MSIAIISSKQCSSDCEGNCTFINQFTYAEVDRCTTNDTSCQPMCVCKHGYTGANCNLLLSEQLQYQTMRNAMLDSLEELTTIEDVSAESVTLWASGLASSVYDTDQLSANCSQSIIKTAQAIVSGASAIGLSADSISTVLTSIDTAITINTNNYYVANTKGGSSVVNATNNILQNFANVVINNMVLGQQPYLSIQNSLKMAVHTFAASDVNSTSISVPKTAYESAAGTQTTSLSLITGTVEPMSLSLVETTAAQYLNEGVNYTSNPISVQLKSTSSNISLTFVMQNVKSVQYSNYSGGHYVNTSCTVKDNSTYVKYCPGNIRIIHQCNGTNGLLVTRCPANAVIPVCRVQFGDFSCTVLDHNESSTTCHCVSNSTVSSRRRLSVASKIQSVALVSMFEFVAGDTASTFATYDDQSALVLFQKSFVIVLLFSSLWGIGVVYGGCFIYYYGGPIESKKNFELPVDGMHTHVEHSNAVTEKAINEKYVELMEYVKKVFPSVYSGELSLFKKIQLEMRRHHRYFGMKKNESVGHLSLIIFRVLTACTILLFCVAVGYDLETPNNDGSCVHHENEHSCLKRKSPINNHRSYCTWVAGGNGQSSNCVYEEPVYNWQDSAFIAIVVGVVMVIIMLPIEYLFKILNAPNEEYVKALIENDKKASTLNMPRRRSTRIVNLKAAHARRKFAAVSMNASKLIMLRALKRESVRRSLVETYHVVFENQMRFYRQMLNDKDHLKTFVEDLLLQSCQFQDKKNWSEKENFESLWNFNQLIEQVPAFEKQLQLVDSISKEKIAEYRENGAYDVHIGADILFSLMLDILGNGTVVSKIFEDKMVSTYSDIEPKSNITKAIAFIVVVLINMGCIWYVMLKAVIRGSSWQMHFLFACMVQMISEILIFQTTSVLWCEVIVPQFAYDDVNKALDKVFIALEKVYHEDKIHTTNAYLNDHKAVNVFNMPDYLFVSNRLANEYKQHIESVIVLRYESIYPPNNLITNPLEVIVTNPNSLTNIIRKWFTVTLMSFILIPIPIQDFILSIVQPILFAPVMAMAYACWSNPILLIIALVLIPIFCVASYKYMNHISNKQLTRKTITIDDLQKEINLTVHEHVHDKPHAARTNNQVIDDNVNKNSALVEKQHFSKASESFVDVESVVNSNLVSESGGSDSEVIDVELFLQSHSKESLIQVSFGSANSKSNASIYSSDVRIDSQTSSSKSNRNIVELARINETNSSSLRSVDSSIHYIMAEDISDCSTPLGPRRLNNDHGSSSDSNGYIPMYLRDKTVRDGDNFVDVEAQWESSDK